jgi:hypothetical protein
MSPHDPLAKFRQVPADISPDKLSGVLAVAFGQQPAKIKQYTDPVAFNFLLEWYPTEEQWQVPAYLMRMGLSVEKRAFRMSEVATLVRRSPHSVSLLLKPGKKNFVRTLRTADELMGATPHRNELRAVGLPFDVWHPLAKHDVRSLKVLADLEETRLVSVQGLPRRCHGQIARVVSAYRSL